MNLVPLPGWPVEGSEATVAYRAAPRIYERVVVVNMGDSPHLYSVPRNDEASLRFLERTRPQVTRDDIVCSPLGPKRIQQIRMGIRESAPQLGKHVSIGGSDVGLYRRGSPHSEKLILTRRALQDICERCIVISFEEYQIDRAVPA